MPQPITDKLINQKCDYESDAFGKKPSHLPVEKCESHRFFWKTTHESTEKEKEKESLLKL